MCVMYWVSDPDPKTVFLPGSGFLWSVGKKNAESALQLIRKKLKNYEKL